MIKRLIEVIAIIISIIFIPYYLGELVVFKYIINEIPSYMIIYWFGGLVFFLIGFMALAFIKEIFEKIWVYIIEGE